MGLVVDASALAEYLLGTPLGLLAAESMSATQPLHVPHLAVVETASVLRGWVRGGQVTPARARAALGDLADFPAARWPVEPILERVWDLRENLTVYDATYVALAEELGVALLTADARLARAVHGRATCEVHLLTRSP